MNLLDARRILLVRAFESPLHAPWTEADRDAVTREAARLEGAAADAAPFIARRAALAFERLHARIDEGEDGRVSVASGTSTLAALFAAGATPELETHGAFLRRLQAQAAPGARVLALVDASAFRRRFTGNEGATRLAQRRQAWQALADELGIELIFAELDPTGSRA